MSTTEIPGARTVDPGALTDLQEMLAVYRQLRLDDLYAEPGKTPWVYSNVAELVLDRGVLYPPAPWRGGVQRPGECFAAAHQHAATHSWTYVEGYALVPAMAPFTAIEHAWCLTPQGTVADPALADGTATAYWGLPLRDSFRRAQQQERGTDAVLHAGRDPRLHVNTTVLRDGLPPGALATVPRTREH